MSWIQTSNNSYQEVKNTTGSNISPYKVVYASGFDSTDKVPLISVIDDLDSQLPIGILTNTSIIQNEISHVLVKGDMPYDTSAYDVNTRVYCNNSGDISFDPTPLLIGYVITSDVLGSIHIDVNYVFTSQINNVYFYESESNESITDLDIGSFNYIQLKGYVSLSGISSGFIGRIVAIQNDPTSATMRLLNNSSTSSVGNRLSLPEDEIELQNDSIAKFIYDGSSWKLVGGNYNQNQNSTIISVYQNGTSFNLGTPVYINSSGSVQKAIINTQSNFPARGLVYSKSQTLIKIILSGKIKLTVEEWDLVTGGSGGLVTGAVYYTSSSDLGKITTNKPYIGNPVLIALDSTVGLVQVGILASEPIPSILETWLFR